MNKTTKYMLPCLLLSAALCIAQIIGNYLLILGVLMVFLLLMAWCCSQNAAMLMLLFFLPWSQLLRTGKDSFSFYTFGMVLVCAISIFKTHFQFKRYAILSCILLVLTTLVTKLIDGSGLTFAYIAFLMMVLLFPVVKEEWTAGRYDYWQLVCFFAAGVVFAALAAQALAGYGNIAKYIRVDSYSTITRLCGFYSDPNFYTAQITAALSGCLVLLLREQSKRRAAVLAGLSLLLIYCGLLSGSKSFVLVFAALLLLWLTELLRMKGKAGLKVTMLVLAGAAAVYIATSALLGGLIQVLVTRFSNAENLSDFTTGRTELWTSYLEELLTNGKLLLLGQGFTNIKLHGRASHNTLVQVVYQFGLIGLPLVIAWIAGFFRDLPPVDSGQRQGRNTWILILGSFLPWLAIDILFLDEFFLMQMYVFLGIRYLRSSPAAPEQPRPAPVPDIPDVPEDPTAPWNQLPDDLEFHPPE